MKPNPLMYRAPSDRGAAWDFAALTEGVLPAGTDRGVPVEFRR
jgi:hypothetical protein